MWNVYGRTVRYGISPPPGASAHCGGGGLPSSSYGGDEKNSMPFVAKAQRLL